MKTPLTLLCSLALLAGQLSAQEQVKYDALALKDGVTLKDATILRVDPDGLHISHHDGVSKVKFENLPDDVQKQFAFDRDAAEKFRIEKEAAREAREAEERKERVEGILAKQHAEQDEDLRRGREEFFALLQTGEYSYPQLDKILMDSIAALKAAGRDDLAAMLEDDRKILREREVTRPAESLRKERDELAARVRDLENQLAALNNKPADPPADTAVVWPIFVDRPVFIPQPVVVDHHHNNNTPPVICPPNSTVPRLTPFSPGAPAVRPAVNNVPQTPRNVPQTPRGVPAQNRFHPATPATPTPRFEPSPSPAPAVRPAVVAPPAPTPPPAPAAHAPQPAGGARPGGWDRK